MPENTSTKVELTKSMAAKELNVNIQTMNISEILINFNNISACFIAMSSPIASKLDLSVCKNASEERCMTLNFWNLTHTNVKISGLN